MARASHYLVVVLDGTPAAADIRLVVLNPREDCHYKRQDAEESAEHYPGKAGNGKHPDEQHAELHDRLELTESSWRHYLIAIHANLCCEDKLTSIDSEDGYRQHKRERIIMVHDHERTECKGNQKLVSNWVDELAPFSDDPQATC